MENIRLREMRESRGMSKTDLAAFSGISRVEICNLENGTHKPYADTLVKLAEALDCDVNEIIGEKK